jgi:hypothetical protein
MVFRHLKGVGQEEECSFEYFCAEYISGMPLTPDRSCELESLQQLQQQSMVPVPQVRYCCCRSWGRGLARCQGLPWAPLHAASLQKGRLVWPSRDGSVVMCIWSSS